MQPSFFVQCEKCDSKPATVRLTYGMQEKKICFQCERELLKEPFYRDWNKQFLSYSELRPNRKSHKNLQLPDAQDNRYTSGVRSTLKSPSTTTPHNPRRNFEATGTSVGDKSLDSRAYRSPVMRIDVPKRSEYVDTAGSQGGRSGSRKKNRVYYSEYMKNYNTPKSEYKESTDRMSRHDAVSPYHSPKSTAEFNKYDRARSVAQIDNFTYTPQREELEAPRTNKLAKSGQLESKKEQIRTRLTQLAEKIYSPVKSPFKSIEPRKGYTVVEGSSAVGEQKDYGGYRTSKGNVVSREQTSGTKRRGNADYSNHANNIELLKGHIENLETRHIEAISQLKEELRVAREELLKEKTENAWRNSQDTSQLNKKMNELQKKLDEESSQNRLLRQELQQQKNFYEETIKGLNAELNRARLEKERRVEELSGQSRAQSKSHKDTLGQVQRDNEVFVNKLKNENDYIIKDLNMQIEHKNQEIDRLKQEREEAVLGSAEKAKAGSRYQGTTGYTGSRGGSDSRSRDNLMKKFDMLHNKYSS